jgi:hypothetical protein
MKTVVCRFSSSQRRLNLGNLSIAKMQLTIWSKVKLKDTDRMRDLLDGGGLGKEEGRDGTCENASEHQNQDPL